METLEGNSLVSNPLNCCRKSVKIFALPSLQANLLSDQPTQPEWLPDKHSRNARYQTRRIQKVSVRFSLRRFNLHKFSNPLVWETWETFAVWLFAISQCLARLLHVWHKTKRPSTGASLGVIMLNLLATARLKLIKLGWLSRTVLRAAISYKVWVEASLSCQWVSSRVWCSLKAGRERWNDFHAIQFCSKPVVDKFYSALWIMMIASHI